MKEDLCGTTGGPWVRTRSESRYHAHVRLWCVCVNLPLGAPTDSLAPNDLKYETTVLISSRAWPERDPI